MLTDNKGRNMTAPVFLFTIVAGMIYQLVKDGCVTWKDFILSCIASLLTYLITFFIFETLDKYANGKQRNKHS